MSRAIPANEAQRVAALRAFEILDTAQEQVFDDLTALAANICEAPTALISLVDEDRQWIKSKVNFSCEQTSRDVSFCAHAILEPELLIVRDALADERFAANPLVTREPNIRFYAGSPLITSDGYALGTLCVIDYVARELSAVQEHALQVLSRQVVELLEHRRAMAQREQAEEALQT